MKVAYFPSDLDGPAFYRCLNPAALLSANGHQCVMPKMRQLPGTNIWAFMANTWKLGELDADLYVLQQRREKQWVDGVKDLHFQGKAVLCETDDADICLPKWHPARGAWSPLKSPDINHQWQFRIYQMADAMTVATPALAEMYKHLNPNIHVLRNVLNWEMWAGVVPVYEQEFRRLRVGWMGSYEIRTGDLKKLAWIGRWLERNPHVEFVAASGDSRVHDLLGVPVGQRVTTGKVSFRDLDLAEITAVMDIGLVPLDRIPFNEAKSHLKGMEYAACGIPCIATPTESYRFWVEDGVNGFLADSPRVWQARLDELVADPDLRRRMGEQARVMAEQHTIQKLWRRWEDLYGRIIGSCSHRNNSRATSSVGTLDFERAAAVVPG